MALVSMHFAMSQSILLKRRTLSNRLIQAFVKEGIMTSYDAEECMHDFWTTAECASRMHDILSYRPWSEMETVVRLTEGNSFNVYADWCKWYEEFKDRVQEPPSRTSDVIDEISIVGNADALDLKLRVNSFLLDHLIQARLVQIHEAEQFKKCIGQKSRNSLLVDKLTSLCKKEPDAMDRFIKCLTEANQEHCVRFFVPENNQKLYDFYNKI